jgi:predicted nucleic acid-binding protein
MSQSVVTNAGPLMALSKLNALYLLKQLYGRVEFPRAVYEETVMVGMRHGYSDAYTLLLFLRQHQWQPTHIREIPTDLLTVNLDRGEKEAIALAFSKHALLLMDEECGCKIARQKGIVVHGTLGVLIESYRKTMISEDQLRFYFKQIRERADIWISPDLCLRLLEQVFLKKPQLPQ